MKDCPACLEYGLFPGRFADSWKDERSDSSLIDKAGLKLPRCCELIYGWAGDRLDHRSLESLQIIQRNVLG